MTPPLKPCPCTTCDGVRPQLCTQESTRRERPEWFVMCANCAMRGPRAYTADEAERHWNDLPRATSAPASGDADTARLDFLDHLNRALNAAHGTNYRWEMVINHNVNRLMTGRHLDVDLNDAKAHGFQSCRDAIDREMLRLAASRRARALSERRGA